MKNNSSVSSTLCAALSAMAITFLFTGCSVLTKTPEATAAKTPSAPEGEEMMEGTEMSRDALLSTIEVPQKGKKASNKPMAARGLIMDEKKRMDYSGNAIGGREPDWEERYRIREQEAALKYRMPPLDTPITVTMKKGDRLKGVLKEIHNDGIFLKTGPAEISVGRNQLHMKSRVLLFEDDYCRAYAETWVAREKKAYAARMVE